MKILALKCLFTSFIEKSQEWIEHVFYSTFSHKIPSYKKRGDEMKCVSKCCFEFNHASLSIEICQMV